MDNAELCSSLKNTVSRSPKTLAKVLLCSKMTKEGLCSVMVKPSKPKRVLQLSLSYPWLQSLPTSSSITRAWVPPAKRYWIGLFLFLYGPAPLKMDTREARVASRLKSRNSSTWDLAVPLPTKPGRWQRGTELNLLIPTMDTAVTSRRETFSVSQTQLMLLGTPGPCQKAVQDVKRRHFQNT